MGPQYTRPAVTRSEQLRCLQTVKWLNAGKGYGSIHPHGGGKDDFVHISAVEHVGLSNLNEGQAIGYEEVSNGG